MHWWIYSLLSILPLALLAESRESWLILGDSITQSGHYVDYLETWYLLNKSNPPEIIDLGLSSETVSGLSEPDHPFPRPYLHSRLERVLETVQPDLVMACYGMNCAIYHPFSEERFAAYKSGIKKLIMECRAFGAKVILVTPPPFAGRLYPRTAPKNGQAYGYKHPAPDYNSVLQRYADWILSLDEMEGVKSLTIRAPLERYMEISYSTDPVHPNEFGHKLMGEAILWTLEEATTESDSLKKVVKSRMSDPRWRILHRLVRKQREVYDRTLLNSIGHGNPAIKKRFTLSLEKAKEMNGRLESDIAYFLSLHENSL